MTPDTLAKLQTWYRDQCDGDWEHEWRVRINNIDNPGWDLTINLWDTSLADATLERIDTDRTENDWYSCWVEASVFHAVCGPTNLNEVIELFLSWFEKSKAE